VANIVTNPLDSERVLYVVVSFGKALNWARDAGALAKSLSSKAGSPVEAIIYECEEERLLRVGLVVNVSPLSPHVI